MDQRDVNAHVYLPYEVDEQRRVIYLFHETEDEVELPLQWAVCGTCEGEGKHVNPSIDSNGLTADDFAEDPDFQEDYFSGIYDVACSECKGRRVVPTSDDPRFEKAVAEAYSDAYTDARMRMYESGERW